ncbi:MAG: hypothetical protein O9972_24630 [Burkholderiales bacterium]|nr:hypothetical protein [Burkholderiales bacterium]
MLVQARTDADRGGRGRSTERDVTRHRRARSIGTGTAAADAGRRAAGHVEDTRRDATHVYR